MINALNFLTNKTDEDEFEYIEKKVSAEQNEKRKKRDKAPLQNTTYIRLSDKLKKYIYHYNSKRGQINVRFLVKGHWMEFKDDRYKNMKGKRVWIYPFWKNEDKLETSNKTIKVEK